MADHGRNHWLALKWLLRYLKGAARLGIMYGGNKDHSGNAMMGFCDSDYAGDIDNRRSQTGYVFTMYGSAASWKSIQQHVVALSTTEAEYLALAAAIKESFWLKGLAAELGVVQKCIAIGCDSNSAIALAKHQCSMSGASTSMCAYTSSERRLKKVKLKCTR
ncbi:secreted RxLR effector protein 161-like [Salvia hispanica]|uniref:secreted RxLR effector protein 161-like n=1 Tax=Salvia hispanica TaxID=49212 RepID=UPI0020095777|nr:secreted RxLR effector protein 161-like [Salvia hispanica]